MDTPAHSGHSIGSGAATSDRFHDGPTNYFVADGDSTAGPYTAAELRARLANGALTPENHVCLPGWGAWKKIGDLSELSGWDSALVASVKPPALPPAAASSTAQNTTAAKVLLGVGLSVFIALALGNVSGDAFVILVAMVFIFAGIFGLGQAGLRLIDKARPGTTKQLRLKLKQMVGAPNPEPRCNPSSSSATPRMWLRHKDDTQSDYSVEELRLKLARGAVSASDYVWQEGWLGWRKIADVDSLKPSASQGASPPRLPLATCSGATGSMAAKCRSWLREADQMRGGMAGPLAAIWQTRFRPLLLAKPMRTGLAAVGILVLLCLALPPACEQLRQAAQARDPVMAQRTAEAWRTFSAIELETSQTGDARRRLILLSQLELNDVDPLLMQHIRQTGEAAKVVAELSVRFEGEKLKYRAESRKATELMGMLGGVVGLLGSGRGSSPDTIQRNMALGQQVGDLGARVGGVFDDLQFDGRLQAKFGHEIAAAQSEAARLEHERKDLAERLAQKYRRPFLLL
jgi:GYF domain 2